MENARNPGLEDAVAAALGWWREAGVDCAFEDEPTDWLSRPEPARGPEAGDAPADTRAAIPSAPPSRRAFAPRNNAPSLDLSSMPADLAAFQDWWLSEPSLDAGRTSGRIAPRGPVGAKLMVIVPEPEREDSESLLSGPQGRLLDAFLSATGIGAANVYLASALPRHTPAADWAGIAASGMGEVLSRHVVLAAPERVIAFDGNILPLLGNDPAQEPAVLRSFNHEGSSMPLLAARGLQRLIERPAWKRDLWRAWLDWAGPA